MHRKTVLAGVAVAAVTALGIGIPAVAQGDGARPASTTAAASAADSFERPGADQRRAERRTELADRLAQELGIDSTKVADALGKVSRELRAEHRAARLDALEARLDRAVESGRINRAQADRMLAAARDGGWFGRHGMRGMNGMRVMAGMHGMAGMRGLPERRGSGSHGSGNGA